MLATLSLTHFPKFSPSVPQFPHFPIPLSPNPLCFLYTSLNSPSSSCHSPLRSSSFPSLLPTFAFLKERNKMSSELFAIMSFQLQFHYFSFFLVLTDAREKYDGTRRSPWNEIECGDHYVRPMAAFLFFELASGQVGCWNSFRSGGKIPQVQWKLSENCFVSQGKLK